MPKKSRKYVTHDSVTVTFRIPTTVRDALDRRAWLRSETLTAVLLRAIDRELHPTTPEVRIEGFEKMIREAQDMNEANAAMIQEIREKLAGKV